MTSHSYLSTVIESRAFCCQMVGKAPQVFAGLSLEDSIKPRVAHLLSAVAVDRKGLPKVLSR